MKTSRDRLLDAAREIFAKEGLDGLSIRQVASAAGLSSMAMYRHFADKDALVDALMREGFAAWERIASGIEAKSPMRWLEQLCEAFLDFALKDPHHFDAAFLLPASEARKYPDDFASGRSPVVAMAVNRIVDAQAQKLLVPLPPLRVALLVSGLMQGLVSMHRARRFESDAEFRKLYRTALKDCLASLAPGGNQK